jgi:hypothetical protein
VSDINTLIREMVREEVAREAPNSAGILSMIDRRLESNRVTNMLAERISALEAKPAIVWHKSHDPKPPHVTADDAMNNLANLIRNHTRPPSVTVTLEDVNAAWDSANSSGPGAGKSELIVTWRTRFAAALTKRLQERK